MSHSTVYRICLLVVVVLTIIGGIFYYVNYMEHHRHTQVTEGTLVMEEGHNGEKEAMCGVWSTESEEGEGMVWLETQKRYI
ncbi:MAG: hypothetical protein HFI71_02825 [Lachnospiraceae bacterium]|nr:hypothetical protein [Lachnospiraceae bacterium]